MKNITPGELRDWLSQPERAQPLLLDVREPWEYQHCHLENSMLMPVRSIPARLPELERAAPTVVLCHHGIRSLQVAHFLVHHGFTEVYNLAGGVDAWARTVDPAMPVY